MKRYFKLTVIFLLSLTLILTACAKEEQKTAPQDKEVKTEEKNETETQKSEKAAEKVKEEKATVVGATIGSSKSNNVVDREVWKGRFDGRFDKVLQDPVNGLHIPEILLDSPDAKKVNKKMEDIVKGSFGYFNFKYLF